MGVLHLDTTNRDSLACDLMEPVRPDVDAYVLKWILRQPLKRSWFFEERNGNCRLMADLAILTAEFYSEKMQPLIAELPSGTVVRHLRVSRGYANEIRHGRVPHPRHWMTLAKLTGSVETEDFA